MKKVVGISIGAAVVVVMIAIWMMFRAPSEEEVVTRQRMGVTVPESSETGQSSVVSPPAEEDKFARMAEALKEANVLIEFWGVVRDQDGIPLPGVSVGYRVQTAGTVDESGDLVQHNPTGSIETGANGVFRLTNETGMSLIIESLVKDGYSMDPNQRLVFGYAGTPRIHLPEKGDPHPFVMVENDSIPQIAERRFELVLPWDGKPVRVDMESGEVSGSGDLVVTAHREPGKARFGWQVSVSVRGGGIQAAQKGKGFVAPDSGYQASWKCEFPSQSGEWRFGYDEQLFYRKADRYGRLALQIYADAPPGSVGVYIDRYVNPSGGRFTGE